MMNTSFFKQVANLNITGNLQVAISKGADNKLIVSVLLNNEQCGDNAKQFIPPLLLKGTGEELDNGFFENITQPIEQTSSLLLNMEDFLKQSEVAKAKSAMEKEKTDKDNKVKDEKEKKFKEAMQKTDELEKAGKYREAWMKLPAPAQFPEQADIIEKRRTALTAKFAPDLFAEETEPQEEKIVSDETLASEELQEDEDEILEEENDELNY